MDTEKIKEVYADAATVLEKSRDEFSSVWEQHEFLTLKLIASIIHTDVCREYQNLILNQAAFSGSNETSTLLVCGQLIVKLFEAHRWYNQSGNRRLLQLAQSRGIRDFVESEFDIHANRIEKYKRIRNMMVHYDDETIHVIQELRSLPSEEFFNDIARLIKYGNTWLQALRSIGKLESPVQVRSIENIGKSAARKKQVKQFNMEN